MIWRRIRRPVGNLMVIVGGQCRKVGKTALVADLIQKFPERQWTAVKVTPYAHEGCPVRGAQCKCAPYEHAVAIRTEKNRNEDKDTSRFLAAGAKRALWVQTKEGLLRDALPQIEKALTSATDIIIESDALARFWQPDLFLMVLDPRKADFKASACRVKQYADGFVLRSPDFDCASLWSTAGDSKPRFLHPLGYSLPAHMQNFVRQRFRTTRHLTLSHGRLFS